jgi:hypothetical protein
VALIMEIVRELTDTERAVQAQVARGLRDLHTKLPGSEECWWCFERWPCPDARWSARTLRSHEAQARAVSNESSLRSA